MKKDDRPYSEISERKLIFKELRVILVLLGVVTLAPFAGALGLIVMILALPVGAVVVSAMRLRREFRFLPRPFNIIAPIFVGGVFLAFSMYREHLASKPNELPPSIDPGTTEWVRETLRRNDEAIAAVGHNFRLKREVPTVEGAAYLVTKWGGEENLLIFGEDQEVKCSGPPKECAPALLSDFASPLHLEKAWQYQEILWKKDELVRFTGEDFEIYDVVPAVDGEGVVIDSLEWGRFLVVLEEYSRDTRCVGPIDECPVTLLGRDRMTYRENLGKYR